MLRTKFPSVAFANFGGVNIPTMADFKLTMRRYWTPSWEEMPSHVPLYNISLIQVFRPKQPSQDIDNSTVK